MRKIKVSKEVSFPIDAVTQTFAAIGRKGAGKTYLATMIAEQMLDAKAQVVAIDPVGNWWGLRVDADGKSNGKEIFVIGGENGDIPLVPEAGAKIAQLVVEKGISAVLDVSSFRLGERKRFVTDFGEEILHLKKKDKTPMHLFIEEAQLIIPQRVGADEARMVGAFEQIVRLGRNYGIGATLVTQRPQSVNKEVLSQVECLCVLQVTGPHERKALEFWVQEAGAERALIGELPSLSQGEGYIWSPSWLRIFKKVKFSKKTTFDASATPVVGKQTKQAKLSSVDIKKLQKDMADIVEKVQADDPKFLKKRVRELERELEKGGSKVSKKDIEEALKPHLTAIESEREAWKIKIAEWEEFARGFYMLAKNNGSALMREIEQHLKNEPKKEPIAKYKGEKVSYSAPKVLAVPKNAERAAREIVGDFEGDLPKGEKAVLVEIAKYKNGLTRKQVSLMTGYKRSSRDTYIQRLFSKGLLQNAGDYFLATDSGIDALGGDYETAPNDPKEIREHWLRTLPQGERLVFQQLVEAYPHPLSREEISDATGYKRSSRDTYIQRLSTRQLVEVTGSEIAANDDLF